MTESLPSSGFVTTESSDVRDVQFPLAVTLIVSSDVSRCASWAHPDLKYPTASSIGVCTQRPLLSLPSEVTAQVLASSSGRTSQVICKLSRPTVSSQKPSCHVMWTNVRSYSRFADLRDVRANARDARRLQLLAVLRDCRHYNNLCHATPWADR